MFRVFLSGEGDSKEQKRMKERTYEVMIHSVFDIVLRDGVFSIDDLQFGPLFKWVLLKAQQVEDASKGLYGKETTDNNKLLLTEKKNK